MGLFFSTATRLAAELELGLGLGLGLELGLGLQLELELELDWILGPGTEQEKHDGWSTPVNRICVTHSNH